MIKGIVNENEEPIIELDLVLNSRHHNLKAVIDTGFNGYISVPQKLVNKSGWYFIGYEEYEIATGEKVRQKVYLGKIIFDRIECDVYILTSKAQDILVGTKLLKNKVLKIDFKSKKVEIFKKKPL